MSRAARPLPARTTRTLTALFLLVALGGRAGADEAPDTLTLSEAFHLALRTSEQVQIAAGNRDIAATTYTDQLTIMGPTVQAGLLGTLQNRVVSANAAGPPDSVSGVQAPYNMSALFQISQPLFRRQIWDARRAAAIGIDGAKAALKRARQQLMFDTVTVFVAVLLARQQLTIANAAVARGDIQLKAAVARVKANAALQTAALLAQIEVDRALVSVNQAQGQLLQQESVFQRIVGVHPPATLLLPSTPTSIALNGAADDAVLERADLRSLRLATAQARATVEFLKGKIFWPTLDVQLSAGFKITATSSGNPPDYRYGTYGLFGVFNVPLFQTGDEWLQVKLQRERVGIAANQESFLRRQVSDDVRQATANLVTANKAIDIATKQQKTAQQNYTMVSQQYEFRIPQATFLDVATAQGAVFEAETNLAIASYQRELAAYQLLFAEGTIDL